MLYINKLPGILKLSDKKLKTCKSRGYIKKQFFPIFNYFDSIWIKTNKIKHNRDVYVIINVLCDADNNISGTIDSYIGDVGNIDIERSLCNIIANCHWKKKIDRTIKRLTLHNEPIKWKNIGITFDDITPLRKNMNDIFTHIYTIDPEGSQDIDDAISIYKDTVNNSYVLGIHIADPTSYVIENSIIDIEMRNRFESIYLDTKTFHMFPDVLSTNLFSLKYGKKSRAFSVLFNMSIENDNVIINNYTITKSLVNITHNLSYKEFETINNEHTNMLRKIGKSLRTSHYNLSNDMYDSKRMIEVYMILANNTIAKHLVESYRNTDDIYNIILRTQTLSHNTDEHKDIENSKYHEIHKKINLNAAQMTRFNNDATKNRHSILDLDLYTHFTSPIRRYTDIIIHRLLWNSIKESSYHNFELDYVKQDTILEKINNYKQHYKKMVRYEQELIMYQYVIENIFEKPNDRILKLHGVIVNINIETAQLQILCTEITKGQIQNKHDVFFVNKIYFISLLSKKMLTNNIWSINEKSNYKHIIMENTAENKLISYELYQPIDFNICFVANGFRKILSYVQ